MDRKPGSTFVTAVAWTFIVLAGVATFISLLQNVLVNILAPAFETDFARVRGSGQLPWIVAFMFEHVRLLMAIYLLLSTATFVSAIGLLKRQEWARLVFIAMMAIGIALNAAGVALSFAFYSAIPSVPPTTPSPFGDQAKLIVAMIIGINVLFTVGLMALFAWIIKRLISAEVRSEFLAD